MNTSEIKALIQSTIAGQGSQVDIGGKLAEILVSIVDAIPSGEMPRPIVLTAMPEDGDTVETLAAKGLTVDEIIAASRGERTGVVASSAAGTERWDIFSAYNLVGARYIAFGIATYMSTGEFSNLTQYAVTISPEDDVRVEFFEM